jgi:murein DD-endopeptidase MepM/ murein hydrolase activator NlpD
LFLLFRRGAFVRHRLLFATVVVLLMAPFQALAQSSSELERDLDGARGEADGLSRDLDDVRSKRAAEEQELAEIGARLADAQGRLRQAEGQVSLAEAALLEAEEVHEGAVEDHRRAEEQLAAAEEALAFEEGVLAEQIVEGFKYGTVGATRGAMMLEVLRRADDPNAFSVGMKQLRTVVEVQDETVQNVIELRQERQEREDDAARSRARASQAEADAADTLRLVEDLRAQAADLTDEVAREEEEQERVVATLRLDEQQTAELLDRAASRQAELESALRAARAEEQRQEEARQAEQRRAAQRRSSSNAGASGGPDVPGGYCPVEGAVAGRDFSNDWGYPRSGGRTHQGNDIFANRGRPVIAIDDGTVVRMNANEASGGLGGITLTYRTGDGSEWYNAHLESISSGLSVGSRVSAGGQIGRVGNTGNARTTPPHNHLGRRYNGSWVNPYPTISKLCR